MIPLPPSAQHTRPKAALLTKAIPLGYAYDEATLASLAQLLELKLASPGSTTAPAPDPDAELILSGWGMPRMDERFFEQFPHVRAVFYAGGSIRSFMTDTAWDRGVRVTSAASVNARPVAEFTFAQIVLSLKCVFAQSRDCRANRRFARQPERIPGAFGSTVGLISLGEIGRMVAQRLTQLEVQVVAFDPYTPPSRAAEYGVTLLPLEEVFARSDVVSCHAPLLPTTTRLIRGEHLAKLPPQATFINTSRGAVVAEDELIEVLQRRPDLTALLDVTDPEPPSSDSPLFTLPNVFLTPHISGSVDRECHRMGHFVLEEVQRYLRGEPLLGEVTRARAERMA